MGNPESLRGLNEICRKRTLGDKQGTHAATRALLLLCLYDRTVFHTLIDPAIAIFDGDVTIDTHVIGHTN